MHGMMMFIVHISVKRGKKQNIQFGLFTFYDFIMAENVSVKFLLMEEILGQNHVSAAPTPDRLVALMHHQRGFPAVREEVKNKKNHKEERCNFQNDCFPSTLFDLRTQLAGSRCNITTTDFVVFRFGCGRCNGYTRWA